jgi:hypothetical protein
MIIQTSDKEWYLSQAACLNHSIYEHSSCRPTRHQGPAEQIQQLQQLHFCCACVWEMEHANSIDGVFCAAVQHPASDYRVNFEQSFLEAVTWMYLLINRLADKKWDLDEPHAYG